MPDLDRELACELAALQQQGLRRELRQIASPQGTRIHVDGQALLNFSSNDYLGLANSTWLKRAALEAVEKDGAGSGASRLISGSLGAHTALERDLAAFKGTAAALTFCSGYATALGTVGALVGPGDVVVLDRLVHASIVDAARLSSAKIRVFAHNSLEDLKKILVWAETRSKGVRPSGSSRPGRILVITESIFSMDGDAAPLRQIVELKEAHGAWLMLDEAHATGVYGQLGGGLADAEGVRDRVEVHMGTLGKALGAAGGYICGSQPLIDLLINRARSFIFSTAPVPAAAGAAAAAVRLVQGEIGIQLRAQLWERVTQLRSGLENVFAVAPSVPAAPGRQLLAAIVPWIVGSERLAVHMAAVLRAQGIFVPAIRYPAVARGRARLRVTVTASHTADDVAQLLAALAKARDQALPST